MGALLYNSNTGVFEDAETPKVYSGGAFTDAEGKVYDGSSWVDAWGSEPSEIDLLQETAAGSVSQYIVRSTADIAYSNLSSSTYFVQKGCVYGPFNLTNYTRFVTTYYDIQTSGAANSAVYFAKDVNMSQGIYAYNIVGVTSVSLDISAMTGEYYVLPLWGSWGYSTEDLDSRYVITYYANYVQMDDTMYAGDFKAKDIKILY